MIPPSTIPRPVLLCLLALLCTLPAVAQKRRLKPAATQPATQPAPPPSHPAGTLVEITPVIPFVFFDSGSAVVPSRYHRYASASEAAAFGPHAYGRSAIDQHHHVLDIVGERMRRQPATTATIVGCTSEQPAVGEVPEIAAARGVAVRDYLVRVWGIDTARLPLQPRSGFPVMRSNPKDPLGIVENRRAEIVSSDWELTQPVTVVSSTIALDSLRRSIVESADTSGAWSRIGASYVVRAQLALFRFDSPEAGPHNERIVREVVLPHVGPGAVAVALGTIDVDEFEHRVRLTQDRARTVTTLIAKERGATVTAIPLMVGDRAPLYDISLPEARFLSRGVDLYVLVPAAR